jgi:hypothetical protein
MQTSKAQNTPSMSELFYDLTNLMKPQVESYQKDLQAAQAITPIDPSILQQAVATGGPLSTAQDFASSSAWAMTPEMFKQTMERRPDLGRQISEATTLSDAIFGRTASRKAAEGLAAAKFGAAKESTSTAARMREGVLDRTLRAEEGVADRALRASESAADRALRESQFSRNLAQRQREWADKMTEIKAYQAASGISGPQALQTPIADHGTFAKTQQWLAKNPLESMKDSVGKRAWINTFMDSVAMNPAYMYGTKGSFLLPEPLMYNKTKVKRVIARPHEAGMLFYAVDAQGKPLIQEPVHFTPRQVPKQSGVAGRTTNFYNRFNPTEE